MTLSSSASSPSGQNGAESGDLGQNADKINLEALAERILRLIKEEARLEAERSGRGKNRTKSGRVSHG